MKKYTFEIVITEGHDEFWEELEEKGETGCDDVKSLISCALSNAGFDEDYGCEIKLKKFEDID